jgi:hypothetical protein
MSSRTLHSLRQSETRLRENVIGYENDTVMVSSINGVAKGQMIVTGWSRRSDLILRVSHGTWRSIISLFEMVGKSR